MTLEQLRIFLVVAERLHVTRAAEALHLTQSAVSASIAALEERHGVKLFDRIGRRIALTEAGRLFVPEARATLARAEAATLVLEDLGGQVMGHLRIHASQTVASYWLPPRLVRFHEQFPRVAISLSVGNTADVARAVTEGAADVGVVEGLVAQPDLDITAVGHDDLVLVVGKAHDWAERSTPIKAAEFGRTAWILRERGSGTRAAFQAILAEKGLALADLEVTLELPSNEAVLAAVAAGRCATVASHLAADPAIAAGSVIALAPDLGRRTFSALSHRERYRTGAVRQFLACLENPEKCLAK
ncbi:HTH-type transcriptional activator CmpR [Hartmannibacter diazotrophicus]|uniref:HTH-type transcriptional activator CmpR n=1 Tax=Hartmannibacter diazotrophicus TaxID=1482074 RepID=A0A2C9D3D6_9HYPH|nr:LysR family transcriptional regulator [Hartmannibacter diazotrophicus]SON54780.1 HTH-type transcriptional activator CmpR [Hartmannibacter diazotrophicus]